MAHMAGVFRIGRDPELRTTQRGDPVMNLALAYNYGQKVDGKRPTQWVEASLWGKRAEALAPYLAKGGSIFVTLNDVSIQTYEGRDGRQAKLVGQVSELELIGQGRGAEPKPEPKPETKPEPKRDFEDDIPF